MSLDDFLTEDELLGWDDIKEETIEVPEWGNRKVRIRGLTLEQMAALATKASRPNPRGGADIVDRELSVALTVAYGMVQPKIKPENVGRLKQKSAAAITRIVQAINALGPTQEAIDEASKSDEARLNGAIPIFPSSGTADVAPPTPA